MCRVLGTIILFVISEVSAHRNCGALEIRVLLFYLLQEHGGKKTLIVVDRLNSNMFIVFQAVQELRLQVTSLIHSFLMLNMNLCGRGK